MLDRCPCSEAEFAECCGPYLAGDSFPTTPEALMRSRYSAFVTGNIDYIFATMTGAALKDSDYQSTKQWAIESSWLGLEVLESSACDSSNEGFVTFEAKYQTADGVAASVKEKSRFIKKKDNRWYYESGTHFQEQAVSDKVGRNTPCPCGSGKKYKKCCG